jgi:RNA polymerase sigma factor (TIGR02999 family)
MPASDLTLLLQQAQPGQDGHEAAREALFAVAYPELRRLAHARLRDGGRNTVLDTTALVHESYLRFQSSGALRTTGRRGFFAFAAQVMRSVIIDTVREHQAQRRGGQHEHITLDSRVADGLPHGDGGAAEVLHVHEALQRLAEAEPELAQLVEMRYFGGFSDAEIAQTLEINERTVRRHWDKARLLLLALLEA